jgi:hypothetical protein
MIKFNHTETVGGHRILFIAGPDLGGEYAGVIDHLTAPHTNLTEQGWGLVGVTWDRYGKMKDLSGRVNTNGYHLKETV